MVSLHPDGEVSTWGVVLGVVAAGCWAFGTIAAKRFSPRLEPLWAVALPLVAGGAALTLFAGVIGDLDVDPSGRVAFGVAWTTLVGTAMAWLIWMGLVSRARRARSRSASSSCRLSRWSWAGRSWARRSVGHW